MVAGRAADGGAVIRHGGGMLGAAVRGALAVFAGFAAWQIPAISHGYARMLAEGVRWSVALATGRATQLVDTPSTVAPGLGIVVAPVRLGADPVGLPLAWTHLAEVGIGLVVFAAMLLAWGAWPSSARPPRFGVRAVAGAVALVVAQIVAIALVAWGSMPGGAVRVEQAGGLLESGMTWVVPALAWTWVVWGAGETPRSRRRLPRVR